MIKNTLGKNTINTEAKSVLKGFDLQVARVVQRMLQAALDGRKNVFFTMEHIDDVFEMNINNKKVHYLTEQDKEYATNFSINSEEIKKTLRIFFDNWYDICETSESIRFLFYTNASIAKEKRIGVLKDIKEQLPEKALLQLLVEKDYDSAFPFVLPVFKEYYLEQYRRNKKDIDIHMQIWDSLTYEKWKVFFDLIEWNFGGKTSEEIWSDNEELVRRLCGIYKVEYSDAIMEQIIGRFILRMREEDFLDRIIPVSEIEKMFMQLYMECNHKAIDKLEHRIYETASISDDIHGSRFRYNANLISLRGREKEMKYLHDFCDSPGFLKWTAICGQGGSGKTRLAYEFCRDMEEQGWYTVLPCRASGWLKYNSLNTAKMAFHVLVCLDYVKYDIEDIEEFMRLLTETGQFSEYKIRIILIERNIGDFDDMVQEESGVKEYLYLPETNDTDGGYGRVILLEELKEMAIRFIVRDYVDEYKKQLVIDKTLNKEDEDKILDVLCTVDPEGKRPLYALVIADAWCAGEQLHKWNKSAALQYIIGKEIRRIDHAVKEMDLSEQEKSVYNAAVKYAVTLATYVESITVEDIYDFVGKSFDVDRKALEWILKETDFLVDDGQKMISLEPDLVGEYWCLQILDKLDEKTVQLFFENILNKYFFDTISFSNKLYIDYKEMVTGLAWFGNIERVKYPEEYTYVRKNAFRNYHFIKNVVLHNHITRIEAGAFRNCKNLEHIVFPPSLEIIGLSAFSGCSSLVSALPCDKKGLEPSIISIQDYAFKECISLTEMVIPESVDSIGHSVFRGCRELKEIIIPRKINLIGDYTFANCSELEKVEFSYRTQSNKIEIQNKAFWGCKKLCEIKGKERISHIGEKAFDGCESLVNVSFSSQLCAIGAEAFSNCTGLTEADLSDCRLGILPNRIFYNCGSLESVQLPEELQEIGEGAFFNCRHLLKVSVPDNVNKIGRYAFFNCISLEYLKLPCSDVRVMDHAVSGCEKISFKAIENIPDEKNGFCGFVFSTITEREINFLTSYAAEENVKVPDSVIRIGTRAFYKHRCLTKVRIPRSVTAIGDEAFETCDSLVLVDAGANAISEIGRSAFRGCTSLKRFIGKLGLNRIEDYAFERCAELEKISIMNSLKKIGNYAFAYCTKLKIVFGGSGILSLSIGLNAFLRCKEMPFPINPNHLRKKRVVPHNLNLYGFVFRKIGRRELDFLNNFWNQKDVIIPETCVRFKGNLFFDNKKIKTIQVPKSIRELPRGAFSNCLNLESIRLPGNLKRLSENVFLNCKSLKQFVFDGFPVNTIPDNVMVEKGAFSGCALIKEIKLPGKLKVIKPYTFFGCQSLREIDLPDGLTRIEKSAFQLCEDLRTVVIPASLAEIDYCAFMECKSLQNVTGLERSHVQVIKNDAFKKCTGLETIHLPENLRKIGAGVFYSCHSLKSINLPVVLEEIGMSAFEECYKLRYIKIPYNITRIEKFTFKYCSSLQQVDHFHGIEYIGASAFYNCNSLRIFRMPKRMEGIGGFAFAFCRSLEEVEIPDTVRSLPNGLFEGCTSLKKVRMRAHIKCIPVNCFKDCGNLTDINLPMNLKTIGAGAFRNCHSFDPLVLPDTLKGIYPSAFRFCDKLSKILIPSSVKKIDVSAFGYCSNLESVAFESIKQVGNYAFSNCLKLREIPIQNIEERIGIAAFQNCVALSDVHFSETITTIDSGAFKGCLSIRRLIFPHSVNKICGGSFRDNTALEEVSLPETIEIIKKSAFRDCINLETVEIKSVRIEVGKKVFMGCKKLFDLNIPSNSLVQSSSFIDCPMEEMIRMRKDIMIIDDEETILAN